MALIAGIILMAGVHNCGAHGNHLRDVGTFTQIRMKQCDGGYLLIDSVETGPIVVYKLGDLSHRQLHYETVDEFECVYEIIDVED